MTQLTEDFGYVTLGKFLLFSELSEKNRDRDFGFRFVRRKLVGASRFERPTSRTPSECANQTALRPDLLK